MRNGRERTTDVASRCGAPVPCVALFAPAGMLLLVILGIVPLLLPSSSAGSVVRSPQADAARVVHFRRAGALLAPGADASDTAAPLVMTSPTGSMGAILDVEHASILALPAPTPAPHSTAVVVSRRGPSSLETARAQLAGPTARLASGRVTTAQRQLAWPVRGAVTSPFGWRIHPIFGTREFHTGMDIGAPWGAPVVSAYAGTVRLVGWKNGYGQLVVVYHGDGLETAYSHLSATSVQPGQQVAQGQEIGRIGSTGWSTGPHLLFEVFKNGVPQNPAGYLQ